PAKPLRHPRAFLIAFISPLALPNTQYGSTIAAIIHTQQIVVITETHGRNSTGTRTSVSPQSTAARRRRKRRQTPCTCASSPAPGGTVTERIRWFFSTQQLRITAYRIGSTR